jgi:hypothetical protein
MMLAQIVLSNSTGVSLGVIALVAPAITWIAGRMYGQANRLDQLERDVAKQWTQNDMKIWTLTLDNENASLNVPDPLGVVRDRQKREHRTISDQR